MTYQWRQKAQGETRRIPERIPLLDALPPKGSRYFTDETKARLHALHTPDTRVVQIKGERGFRVILKRDAPPDAGLRG